MENIPSSFMGYNKQAVNELIQKKDSILSTQKKDINYLRNEITRLEKQIKTSKKTNQFLEENSEENSR